MVHRGLGAAGGRESGLRRERVGFWRATICVDTPTFVAALQQLLPQLSEDDLCQLESVPLLVFANKQDLLNAWPADQVMKELELTGQKTRWVHIQGCSAKTGEGLEDGLAKLKKKIEEKDG